jgi:hypothetical protein
MRAHTSIRLAPEAISALDKIAGEQAVGASRSGVLRLLLRLGLDAWLKGHRDTDTIRRPS